MFRGRAVQKGYGLGSVLGGLFKSALPLLTKAGTSIGKSLLRTGINVAKDTISGQNIKKSLKNRFTEAGRDLLAEAKNSVSSKAQRQKRPLNKRKRPRNNVSSSRALKKKRPSARGPSDIFS